MITNAQELTVTQQRIRQFVVPPSGGPGIRSYYELLIVAGRRWPLRPAQQPEAYRRALWHE
jgi:hypothetical protein